MNSNNAQNICDSNNIFWIVNSEYKVVQAKSLHDALRNAAHHYYALCDYSFSADGNINFNGNVWAVGKDIRIIFINFMKINSLDDDMIASTFEDKFGFAYWILLPTTRKLYNNFIRNKTVKFSHISYKMKNNHAKICN